MNTPVFHAEPLLMNSKPPRDPHAVGKNARVEETARDRMKVPRMEHT